MTDTAKNTGGQKFDQQKTGEFIALLRREQGLTQAELGERLGVTNKTISRWERGNYMPDLALIPDLAAHLGVSVSELFAAQRFAEQDYKREADATLITVTGRLQEVKALRRKQRYLLDGVAFCFMLLAYVHFVGFIPPDKAARSVCLGLVLVAAGLGCRLFRSAVGAIKSLAEGLTYCGGFLCLSSLICSRPDGEDRLLFTVIVGVAVLIIVALNDAYEKDIRRLLEPEPSDNQ